MVGATNKSIAAVCGAWFCRNFFQLCPDGPVLRTIYLGDRRLSDIKTKLEKLALDARRTPQGIFEAYPPDQRPQFWIKWWPPSKIAALPTPIPAKTVAMPPHQRIRLDDPHDIEN
jgi:hypothetical protein